MSSNGRVEATEIDIATRYAGRIEKVLVREGNTVDAGQVVARMNMRELLAQLYQAQAQERQAEQSRADLIVRIERDLILLFRGILRLFLGVQIGGEPLDFMTRMYKYDDNVKYDVFGNYDEYVVEREKSFENGEGKETTESESDGA